MTTLTLYSRGYCHLCDDMLAALQLLQREFAFHINVVDIDRAGDPALLAQYDEAVPVLLGVDPAAPPLCFHFFDEAAVRRHLALSSDAGSGVKAGGAAAGPDRELSGFPP